MDWNLFWEAFGAIGTTIGSLVTAGAVVVAVNQYKQPIEKKIKVIFRSVTQEEAESDNRYVSIEIHNKGVRELTIWCVYIKGWLKDLYLNQSMQVQTEGPGTLPAVLKPEAGVNLLFREEKFIDIIKKDVDPGKMKKKIILILIDSTGDQYKYKCKAEIVRGSIRFNTRPIIITKSDT